MTAKDASQTKTEPELPSKPLKEKQRYLRKIDKPGKPMLKAVWLGGHAMTLVFGGVYMAYYLARRSHSSWVAAIAYKLTLVGVALAYSVAINTQFNIKSLPSYNVLLGTETVQFAILCLIWVFNRSSLFKIYPYLVVSLLQLSNEYNISPVLKAAPILSTSILYNEILLVFVLAFDTLLMRGTSGFALIMYTMFYWLRILQFEHARYFLYTQLIKFDGLMAKIKNPKVQDVWIRIKQFLTTRQAKFEDKYL